MNRLLVVVGLVLTLPYLAHGQAQPPKTEPDMQKLAFFVGKWKSAHVPQDQPPVYAWQDGQVALTLDKAVRAETLPDEILKEMQGTQQRFGKPAEGKDWFAVLITFRKISRVHIEGIGTSPPYLHDDRGDKYKPEFASVRGIDFPNGLTGPGWVIEGGVAVLVFQVPKERTPVSVTFPYYFKEGWDQASEKARKQLKSKTVEATINLKSSGGVS